MHRLHIFSRRFFIGLALCGVCACSPGYQSYRDGGSEKMVETGQRWELALPYKSSEALNVEQLAPDELVLTDKDGPLHITRIPLDGSGGPGRVRYASFEDADSMEVLDEKRLLVLGREDGATKRVRLVDRENLGQVYSVELPFAASTDFTVPGWRQFGDVLVLYQSAITLDKWRWSDEMYQYAFPYVASAIYDLHVIDLRQRTVKSFAGLKGEGLEGVRAQILLSKTAVETMASIGASPSSMKRKPSIEPYVYLIGDVFLVDRGRVLVFELENLDGDSEYFTLALRAPNPTPKNEVAGMLAARYPGELVATTRPEKSGSTDREIKVGGETYKLEHLALVKDGVVAILREPSRYGDEPYSDSRIAMGITPSAATLGEWRGVWRGLPLVYRNPVRSFLEDTEHGVVYFPDAVDDDTRPQFAVRGLRAKDGQWVSGFPANFQADIDSNGKWTGVRIAGTAIDFDRNRLYLHDADENRIVAVELKLER